MKKGMVSIITPLYNSAQYIGETIKSVQNQTYENWEMIIVDDCSTDQSFDIIKQFSNEDDRIKCFQLDQNSGPAAARNKAIQVAEGEYMAFLDADDLWMPEKLSKQIKFMEANNYNFTCTSYEWIDRQGKSLNKVIKAIPKTGYHRLLLDCPVGNLTVMYDVERLGKFKVPNIPKRNDYALWLKMIKKEKYIYGLNEVLAQYRVLENSVSRNKLKVVKYQWDVYRKLEHLSILNSIFHICYYSIIKLLRIK